MSENKFYPFKGYYLERNRDLDVEYESNYWSEVKDPDGQIRQRGEERERKLNDLKQELSYLNNLDGGICLDIGCGLGFTLSGLGPQWVRHGVEYSKYAGAKAAEWGDIHVGTVESACYSDNYFDAIIHL